MNPLLKRSIITAGRVLPDEWYIRIIFLLKIKKWPNLSNPQTFNEKINWLKLHVHDPLYTQMVDKKAVRNIIAHKIGEQYLPKLYGHWKNFDKIDFAKLPKQFVLKCTHDSGSVIVCKDKTSLDLENTKKHLNAHLKNNLFYYAREWPYKNIKPQIIAEELLTDGRHKVLPVYKFFCFNGEVKMLQVIYNDKQKEETCDYFDENGTWLDIQQRFPRSKQKPSMPTCFESMKMLAKKLSSGFIHLRVDFYEVNQKPVFSEFTFYNNAGIVRFEPDVWDIKLGEYIVLPSR